MSNSKEPTVRTRFAPSPTGMLHLGALRTALFKYLFAKNQGGVFILRIDDTDRARFVEGAEAQIIESLKALGLNPDEGPTSGGEAGPYRQSERFNIYQSHAAQLQKEGILYPCWCSAQRLDTLRHAAQKANQPFKYDRHCLSNPGDLKDPHVLRFRIPDKNEVIEWDDAVKGVVKVETKDLDDFVAIKSDGWPTYHFSSIVDDQTMNITHVIRGDEWVASTPKHLLLYRAFGWNSPIFAHTPVILGPDGKHKLSKRDGVKSATDYIAEGYLPEVLVNFLALLGWHPGEGETKEIYSLSELIKEFSLDRIQKSPAKFDNERLEWMNGIYIRQMPLKELAKRAEMFWPPEAKAADGAYKVKVLELVQERLKYLGELPELTTFFFAAPEIGEEQIKALHKLTDSAELMLNEVSIWLSKSNFSQADLEQTLRQLAENGDYKTGKLFGLIRISITGKTAAPGLFETLSTLGKEASLRRIHNAIDALLRA
jgi:glutamyl-tRNA synthetase